MMVVFPGLQFDMTLVIASIGSEGLLGTDALQSCLPHQLDVHGSAMGRWTIQIAVKYSHVFPAPGYPVTSRTQVVHHEIETNGARPVH